MRPLILAMLIAALMLEIASPLPSALPVDGVADEVPYGCFLALVVALDASPATRLDAAQRARVADIARDMEAVRPEGAGLQTLAFSILRPEQKAFVRRVLVAPKPIDPGEKERLLGRLEDRSRGLVELPTGPPPQPNLDDVPSGENVLTGLVFLERNEDLRLSPRQAQQLVTPLQWFLQARAQMRLSKRALLATCTPAQRQALHARLQALRAAGMHELPTPISVAEFERYLLML